MYTRVYKSADVRSKHHLLIGTVRIKLWKAIPRKAEGMYDTRMLADSVVKAHSSCNLIDLKN